MTLNTKLKLKGEQEQLSFVIVGNPDDPIAGNPIPKLKMTGKQQWMPKAQRYQAWKHQVVGALLDSVRGTKFEAMVIRNIGIHGKPFTTKIDLPARMDIVLHWKDNTHGDGENIFGSIADALFKQDKWLAGYFDPITYAVPEGVGKVEVTITLFDNRKK